MVLSLFISSCESGESVGPRATSRVAPYRLPVSLADDFQPGQPQGLLPYGDIKMGNKKAEVFFLCFSSMLVFFLLSPKGPPSCWRAKPIIKAIQLWFVTLVE